MSQRLNLYLHRAYAIQKHLPLTLHATIGTPTVDQDSSTSLTGFNHLINLYRPFDDTFIGLWNKTRTDCSAYYLTQLQQQVSDALPSFLNTTEGQAADLRASQQWLRTVVWQLSMSCGFLSSSSSTNSTTFSYPIEIARDLVTVMQQFSKQAMETHGIGLVSNLSYHLVLVHYCSRCCPSRLLKSDIGILQVEKLFDVAFILVDVMSCVPPSTLKSSASSNPQELLNQLLVLISTLRGGEARYLPLIMAKIRENLPSIGPALPPALVQKVALQSGPSTPAVTVSMNNFPVVARSVAPTATPLAAAPNSHAGSHGGMGGVHVKVEGHPSRNSSTDQSSPYDTPPFMHYYPMT